MIPLKIINILQILKGGCKHLELKLKMAGGSELCFPHIWLQLGVFSVLQCNLSVWRWSRCWRWQAADDGRLWKLWMETRAWPSMRLVSNNPVVFCVPSCVDQDSSLQKQSCSVLLMFDFSVQLIQANRCCFRCVCRCLACFYQLRFLSYRQQLWLQFSSIRIRLDYEILGWWFILKLSWNVL